MDLSAADDELTAMRARLSEADTMVAGKFILDPTLSLILHFMLSDDLPCLDLSAMMAQIENLHLIANNAAASVNARGEAMEFHLQDIPTCAQEIALHGVRHGAIVTLATAQLQSSLDL